LSYGRGDHRARSRGPHEPGLGLSPPGITLAQTATVRRMPTTGLEPVRHFWHWSLKPACLPISARGHTRTKVLGEGFEPSQDYSHRILNPARLPVPPSERFLAATMVWPASGAEGNRTPDLLNAIQALSQLSYSPGSAALGGGGVLGTTGIVKQRCHSAGLTGLEPATSGVTDRHSNQTELQPLHRPRAGDRIRTGDLHVGNVTLYQLSYARVPLPAEYTPRRSSCPRSRSCLVSEVVPRGPASAPTGNRTPVPSLKDWCPNR
jgi:hypothetical protein